jgi:hypothetical protein
MNPAVYGSGFFGGYCLVHIVHAPAMLMDRGELVILGTVHHYHSLLFVITFSILTVGVGSCLMAWERPLYGTPPAWVFFSKSRQNIYGQTQKCIAKNHRLSFLAGQICTRSGARFLLTRKIKKRFSLWHTIDVMRDDANGIYSSKYKGNTCIYDGK